MIEGNSEDDEVGDGGEKEDRFQSVACQILREPNTPVTAEPIRHSESLSDGQLLAANGNSGSMDCRA